MYKSYKISLYPCSVSHSDSFAPGFFLHDRENNNKRIERLKNHIKVGDYFGTLATVVDLLAQMSKEHLDSFLKFELEKTRQLEKLKSDLLHLQQNYKISPKENERKSRPTCK
jgi:hypothetical protein